MAIRSRRRELAATPPASTRRGILSLAAAASAFPARTSTTASWKDAATSSTRVPCPSGVERKTRSAVLSAEQYRPVETLHAEEGGVAAGNQEGDVGESDRLFEEDRVDVGLEVVDAYD